MNTRFRQVAIGGVLLLFTGCAHATLEKKLDAKVSQETDVRDRAALGAETTQAVEKAAGLSDDQKSRLLALRDSTRTQTDLLRDQSLRLRSVLVKDLIASKYNEAEVELIKTRIKALEEKRLSTLFTAVEQANAILGRQAVHHQSMIHEFFDPRGNRAN